MDYYAELDKRKHRALAEVAQLVDEYYQLSHQIESSQKRIAEIDRLEAEREARLKEIDQAQRSFNTYLAVKEGALTLEQIQKGVEQAATTQEPVEQQPKTDTGG